MIKRDLLQRAIDDMGKTLGKIIGDLLDLNLTNQNGIVMTSVSQTLNGVLDTDIGKLLDLSDEEFLNKLKSHHGINHDNMEKFGDILLLLAQRNSDYDKVKLIEKCLAVYEFLERDERIYSFERRSKIERIKEEFKGYLK